MTRVPYRELHGLLLLDKPAGASSNQVLQLVRRLFRAEKAGHTGSLDPLATGLLPICFGEATKIAGVLLGESKSYTTLARLGATTDTDDADGTVLRSRPVPQFDDATLDAALAPLRGRILQRPPIYAALKQGGEPLYAKARRGEAVKVAEREVDVFRIACVERGDDWLRPDWLRLEIDCGSGTYVRSLVRDLGEALGCGAHVVELRRLWVEPFRVPRMFTLPELEALAAVDESTLEATLLPIEAGMVGLKGVTLDVAQAQRLGQGQPQWVSPSQIDPPKAEPAQTQFPQSPPPFIGTPTTVALYDSDGRALGLGALSLDGMLRVQRLFVWAAQSGTVT
ncbi:MAG TPA: tRNA pseudouridine(55) synthase TruB [Xanthomonadaceae bacterium]|nr:tRNA pseudouridine(55) synthase TruB [Xanthomonadaceae bacterium]